MYAGPDPAVGRLPATAPASVAAAAAAALLPPHDDSKILLVSHDVSDPCRLWCVRCCRGRLAETLPGHDTCRFVTLLKFNQDMWLGRRRLHATSLVCLAAYH